MSYSYLFVPGHRSDRFFKAHQSGANWVVIDLEDAVSPPDKSLARSNVLEWFKNSPDLTQKTIVRINGIESEYHLEDLKLLSAVEPNLVMIPKVESSKVLTDLDDLLSNKKIGYIPIIESAIGLMNIKEIVQSKRIERLAFGSVDFQLDTGIPSEGESLLFARSSIVLASAAAQLRSPIDGVTLDISNENQLIRDIQYAKSLGFGAKLCIHPSQVIHTNEGFKPSAAELTWAKEICQAAENANGNAIRLNGKLVDLPVVLRAQRMLQTSHE